MHPFKGFNIFTVSVISVSSGLIFLLTKILFFKKRLQIL